MSRAVIFAGQGEAEVAPRLQALCEARPAWIRLLEDATGRRVEELLARGGRVLERTELLQPALVTLQLAAWEAHREDLGEGVLAGHSLGELAAWAIATDVAAREAIRLARRRGEAMAEVARPIGGGMVAVASADAARALALGRPHAPVARALENGPGEVVLSGGTAALAAVSAAMPVRRIAGVGPWHGPWLRPVAAELAGAIARVRTHRPGRLAARWLSASEVAWCDDPSQADAWIAAQVARPVRWVSAVAELVRSGVDEVVLLGPGRVQRALLRALLPSTVRLTWHPGPAKERGNDARP